MATLQARLEAVIQRIRDQFNTIRPRLVPAGGTAGQVLSKSSGADYATAWAAPAAGGGATLDVQTFTSSGTWTKPANAGRVSVYIQAPGGGGSSGGRSALGTVARGGCPGGPGGFINMTYSAEELPTTVSVGIGARGLGGASVMTDGNAGASGVSGGNASFGTSSQTFYAVASGGGNGTATGAGSAGQGLDIAGPVGGVSSTTGSNAPTTTNVWSHAQPGGAGGGITTSGAGGSGGWSLCGRFASPDSFGASRGNPSTKANATPATIPLPGNYGVSGQGGPGGWANADGTAGLGADGFRGGGGGGGGGGSLNGNPSGKGGDGGAGMIVVVTECFA